MDTVSFWDCLHSAVQAPELLAQYNRLTGNHLGDSARRTPLERLIDQTSGFEQTLAQQELEAFGQFALFVKDCVWERLPPETRRGACWVPTGDFSWSSRPD